MLMLMLIVYVVSGGHTAGQQNIMATRGKVDVKCGTYSYIIEDPFKKPNEPDLEEPALQKQECYGADEFGWHGDIHSDTQAEFVKSACDPSKMRMMKAGDEPFIVETYTFYVNSAPYHYAISWIENCKTTATEQHTGEPLGPDGIKCDQLMRENYEKCKSNRPRTFSPFPFSISSFWGVFLGCVFFALFHRFLAGRDQLLPITMTDCANVTESFQ